MIEERAIIVSITSTLPHNTATLEIQRKSPCGLCGQTQGCGNAMWGKIFAHRTGAFKAQNKINAQVGQVVVVGINERALLTSALLLYIVPLVTMFLVSILAINLNHDNESAIIGALLGLLLGLVWIKGLTSGRQYFMVNQPEILRLANDVNEIQFVK